MIQVDIYKDKYHNMIVPKKYTLLTLQIALEFYHSKETETWKYL